MTIQLSDRISVEPRGSEWAVAETLTGGCRQITYFAHKSSALRAAKRRILKGN